MKYTDLTEVQQQELLMQANIATRIQKKNIARLWLVSIGSVYVRIYLYGQRTVYRHTVKHDLRSSAVDILSALRLPLVSVSEKSSPRTLIADALD